MKTANILILAGQSNAVGCCEVEYLSRHFSKEYVQRLRGGFENIKINYFSHDKKSGGFVKTTFNCTVVEDDTFGPEVGIADALDEKYPGREFFIVKCAFGGVTLLRDFASPSCAGYDPLSYADQKPTINDMYDPNDPPRAGWCYNELAGILKDSIRALEKDGYAPKIKALCWMQGESDANLEEATEKYAKNYDALLRDLKAEFAAYMDKCVFIDAGISTVWERYERINGIKRKYAEKRADCVFIDTIAGGLTTLNEPDGEPDIGHYDSDSGIKLGHMFADKIAESLDL